MRGRLFVRPPFPYAAVRSRRGRFVPSAQQALEPRYGRPVADISDGAWTPSAAGDLYAMLDEVPADDVDYIVATSATTAVMKCTALSLASMSNAVLAAKVPVGFTASGTLTVSLYQGNSPGALVCSLQQVDPAAGLYSHTLTAGEKAAITDGTDLYFRVTAA